MCSSVGNGRAARDRISQRGTRACVRCVRVRTCTFVRVCVPFRLHRRPPLPCRALIHSMGSYVCVRSAGSVSARGDVAPPQPSDSAPTKPNESPGSSMAL
eukprot:1174416-Pyramimonas_sp.AAC.1